MSTNISGSVGYVAALPPGPTQQPFAQGRNGESIVTELHGKYYESNRRGFVWMATQAVAGVVGTLYNATTVSNALACPPGATRGLSLIRVEVAVKVLAGVPVVGEYVLAVSPSMSLTKVTGTAIVPVPGLVGSGATPTGAAFTTATLPFASVAMRQIANKLSTAAPAATVPYFATMSLDFDGTCILQPGTFCTVGQDAADSTNATTIVTYVWEEVDL